ncbi:hypothetical protein PhiH1_390 [Halobacterium phage phiH]|jgi:DNA-directed RNA polymerase specialized sigma subunit|uniref:Uncharacterized protein n=1 Tax=Halobacterium phage phiH TaxID=169684 RepID=A0A3G1ZKV2_BPPHH|nr:hypothetical protein JR051_gp79 [Halobacterium phage phiH]AYM00324.1 hypothetical protein PhiH1_390 [Halobacterium phage phiH]
MLKMNPERRLREAAKQIRIARDDLPGQTESEQEEQAVLRIAQLSVEEVATSLEEDDA